MDLTKPASFSDDINANVEPPCQDSAPPNGTQLNDLPDKCLIAIFKWIPFQNMDDIIELSPRWNKLVQEHVPVEVHLTDVGFRIAMHYFIGHNDLPKYRIKLIHSRVLDEPLPSLKTPEDLHFLEFCTHTEMATYQRLIENAENLRELYFGYSSLSGQPLHEVDVNLPKLKLLCMSDRTVEAKKMDPDQRSILPRNMTGFLGKTFPSIEKIAICTSATRKQTMEYAKELLKFIQRHSETLKIVKFTVNTSVQSYLEISPVNDLVEYASIEEEFNTAQLANVKLTEVDVHFGDNFFCGLEQWRWILQNQTELAHLNVALEKPLNPVIFEAPITLSAENLVTVQLGVLVYDRESTAEDRRSPIDCSLFENCVNLKMLVLRGPPMTTSHARPAAKELENLGKLPKGLFALAIENIYLETKQIAEVTRGAMQRDRELGRLSLQDTGTCQGYGVTLAMLDCWLDSKVLEEIMVKRGMNGDESRLSDYEHLAKFGVTSPITKCCANAYYYPSFQEYRKPADYLPKEENHFNNVPFL